MGASTGHPARQDALETVVARALARSRAESAIVAGVSISASSLQHATSFRPMRVGAPVTNLM